MFIWGALNGYLIRIFTYFYCQGSRCYHGNIENPSSSSRQEDTCFNYRIFEIIIYITALNRVVNNLDNIGNLLAYALGFACGSYIGIYIENKIGLGNLSVQIILKQDVNDELINQLRECGFGVTKLTAYGKDGTKDMLNLIIHRKDLNKLKDIIAQYDPSIFVTSSSITPIRGGYFSTIKRK